MTVKHAGNIVVLTGKLWFQINNTLYQVAALILKVVRIVCDE